MESVNIVHLYGGKKELINQNYLLMYKIIFTITLTFIGLFAMEAQSITETEQTMSYGSQNGFSVDIEGIDLDLTEKVFKNYIKDYGKVKKNKKAKEYYAEAIKIPLINGSEDLAFYIKFDERVNMTSATIWADLGDGFVNSNDNPKEAAGLETFLGDFYVQARRAAIEEEMEEQEKEMKNLSKDLEKLEKKNQNFHDDIADAKKKIEEAEANIEQNLKDQDDQRVLIAKQKEKLDQIIDRLNNVGKD